MDPATLKEILTTHTQNVALWIFIISLTLNIFGVLANLVIAELLKRRFTEFDKRLTAISDRDATRYNYRYMATAKAIDELAKLATVAQGAAADYLWERVTGDIPTKASADKIRQAQEKLLEASKQMLIYKNTVKHLLNDGIRRALDDFYAEIQLVDYSMVALTEKERQRVHDIVRGKLELLQDEFTHYLRMDDVVEAIAPAKGSFRIWNLFRRAK